LKIIVLTSSLYGTASHHLDYLVNNPSIEVCMVVFNEGRKTNTKNHLFRKMRKVFRIGILGALNGVSMRRWYDEDLGKYIKRDNLEDKCFRMKIPFSRTQTINCEVTATLFKSTDAELGISLGNGYISKKIFNIPKYGMINIHHEILPAYQNAQSIIWQLYNGSSTSGYTIHKIDNRIDTGEILYRESIPIEVRDTLADTVTYTYVQLLKNSAKGLVKVLENFDFYFSGSARQSPGISYTTPTIWQYLKMKRQYLKLKDIQYIKK
jgi:methionyl-tRNA formyltransferase